MSLWIYLLCTYLLSGVGFLIYRAIRHRYAFAQRKIMLGLVLVLSLSIPALSVFQVPNVPEAPEATTAPQVTNPALAEQLLVVDPESGNTRINEHNVAIFEPNKAYNWIINNGPVLRTAAYLGMGVTFLMLLVQLTFLARVLRTARRREVEINGHKWQLLYSDLYEQAASFRLHKGYILWNEQLDELPAQERQAILEHEISHLRQRNTWELIFLDMLRVLWIANPFFYLLKREWVRLSEFIADQAASDVLGDKAAYAELLLAQQTQQAHRGGFLLAFREHPLHQRIRFLARNNMPKKRLWPVVLGLIFSMSLSAAVSTDIATRQQRDFKVYEICYCINNETGQLIFCDDCFTEGLDCACIEEE